MELVLYIYGGCRKLAELGFKRSAEKCKEKFEEESRYFNNVNYMKNHRFLVELEELYHGDNQNPQVVGPAEKRHKVLEKPSDEFLGQGDERRQSVENDQRVEKHSEDDNQNLIINERLTGNKKRKRSHKKSFELFKGFCVDIVNKMMAQQEEMHNKLLEDMVKRDEQKLAKEEAWKKKEIVRMNKELELMAHEQAIAGDRQATIIQFLNRFTSTSSSSQNHENHIPTTPLDQVLLNRTSSSPINPLTSSSSSSIQAVQDPSPTCHLENQITTPQLEEQPKEHQNSYTPTPSKTLVPQNPSSTRIPSSSPKLLTSATSQNPNTFKGPITLPASPSPTQRVVPQNPTSNDKDDLGKRWPRDEVLALINLRCSLYNSSEDKEGVKAPLWERISQGMLNFGYKRSAKRCKEKWENINKYFRKTKDVNKKRSMDSRTCPYFHQLSNLYSQGKLAAAPPMEKQRSANSPELSRSLTPAAAEALPETCRGSSQVLNVGSSTDSYMHANGDHQGERTMIQVSAAFDFDF